MSRDYYVDQFSCKSVVNNHNLYELLLSINCQLRPTCANLLNMSYLFLVTAKSLRINNCKFQRNVFLFL